MKFKVGDKFKVDNTFYCKSCRGRVRTIKEITPEGRIFIEEDNLIHTNFTMKDRKHLILIKKKVTN